MSTVTLTSAHDGEVVRARAGDPVTGRLLGAWNRLDGAGTTTDGARWTDRSAWRERVEALSRLHARTSEAFARSAGFASQSEMRAEDWSE